MDVCHKHCAMNAETPIRLLLVDDHHAFRLPFAFVLEREADLTVVAHAGSLAEVRALLPDFAGRIDVALIDLHFPDGSGLEIVREVHQGNPKGRIVILTAGVNKLSQAEAIEAGAVGVLSKTLEPGEIIAAIRRVHAGHALQPVQEIVDLLRHAVAERERAARLQRELAQLSELDRAVLALLVEGLNNDTIAERLGISTKTARSTVARLLAKLEVESRLQASILAVRHGLVAEP